MRNLGVPPTVNQLDTQYTTDFLKTLAERHSYYSGTTNPTVSQIPNKQWIVFKNTTNGEVRLWTNDNGTLKNVLLTTNTTFPAFHAYKSANQGFTSGTTTKVTFDVVDFDPTSSFASSRWTPGVAGYFDISANISVAPSGTVSSNGLIELWKNGATYIRGAQYNDFTSSLLVYQLNTKIVLTATDYLEMFIFNSGAAPTIVAGTPPQLTHFSGYLIRPL